MDTDASSVSGSQEEVGSSDTSEPDEVNTLAAELEENTNTDSLRQWAIGNNVPHTAVSDLLGVMHVHHPEDNLPLDARTLLRTKRSIIVEKFGNGEYHYFGIEAGLRILLQKAVSSQVILPSELKLSFNIDGLPTFKSSLICFWPILCSVDNADDKSPFIVSLFCG